METTIKGYSDDIVCVQNDAFAEEFSFIQEDDGDVRYLAFSDGTIIECRYAEHGIWRFATVSTGRCSCDIKVCMGDGEEEYSDVVTLNGDIQAVVFGEEIAVARKRGRG